MTETIIVIVSFCLTLLYILGFIELFKVFFGISITIILGAKILEELC